MKVYCSTDLLPQTMLHCHCPEVGMQMEDSVSHICE